MNIGDRLRHLRTSKNLTQEEVGRLLGVSKATVNRYETGEIDIKRTTALKLSSILKVSPAYIMGWTDTADTSSEPEILKLYNSLNDIGKQKVIDFINDLHYNPKYTAADKKPTIKKTYTAQIAAQGHGVKNIEVSANMDEVQKIYDDLD